MAANKFYSYYLRGGQLALIEQDINDSSRWKSPASTVVNGLEIEYAYSPRYSLGQSERSIDSTNVLGDTKVVVGSWYIDTDGYLTFNTHAYALDGSVISAGASPYDNFKVEEDFLVSKSLTWNGVHKAKTLFANGYIQTYTKPLAKYGTGRIAASSFVHSKIKSNSDGSISGFDGAEIWVNLALSVGDFVNLTNSPDLSSGRNWLYKVTSITETDGGAESAQKAYLGTKYFLNQEDDIDEWQTGDSPLGEHSLITATKVVYDPCYLHSNVKVLEDETNVIDLPEYLAKALVYYVKAKMAEDQGDMERMQYNEVQFRALMNRYENSRIWGSRRVAPGIGAIR